MKVIFLDNDGVICLENNYGSRFSKMRKKGKFTYSLDLELDLRFDDFDKKAVDILNKILYITGAEIVVSSDWRTKATLEELGEYYLSQGIIKKPIDFTDTSIPGDSEIYFTNPSTELEQTRSLEILEWLSKNPKVTHWVALDDLDLSKRFNKKGKYLWGLGNFVYLPRNKEGIKQTGKFKQIINFLK
jgi:hypothetical protein